MVASTLLTTAALWGSYAMAPPTCIRFVTVPQVDSLRVIVHPGECRPLDEPVRAEIWRMKAPFKHCAMLFEFQAGGSGIGRSEVIACPDTRRTP